MFRRRFAVLLFLYITLGSGCAQWAARLPSTPQISAPAAQILPIEEASWQATEFKGVEAVVLWGDPEHDAQGSELLRIGDGVAFPRHKHTYDERVLVISGTFVLVGPGHEERPLRPGSYYYLPAEVEHASRCDAGAACVVYSEVIPVTHSSRRP